MRAIQITIDTEMLNAIDRDPEVRASGRSSLFRRAVQFYLRHKSEAALDEAYRKGYADGCQDADLGPWEDAQVWPNR